MNFKERGVVRVGVFYLFNNTCTEEVPCRRTCHETSG